MLSLPGWDVVGELVDVDGLLVGEYFALEVDDVVLGQVQLAVLAESDEIVGRGAVAVGLPELLDGDLSGVQVGGYLRDDGLALEELAVGVAGAGEGIALGGLVAKELHFLLEVLEYFKNRATFDFQIIFISLARGLRMDRDHFE